MTAKYGYTITCTPGLVQEGSWPLEVEAFERGEIRCPRTNDSIPAWRTKEEAEQAMIRLCPEGTSPSVYAGLCAEPVV